MGSVGMEKVTSLPVGSFTLYEFFNLPVATDICVWITVIWIKIYVFSYSKGNRYQEVVGNTFGCIIISLRLQMPVWLLGW